MARDRKRRLIKVSASCPSACRLDAYLMTRRTGRHSKLRTQAVKHVRTFSTRTRVVTFHIPAHATTLKPRAAVILVSFDRSGASTRVTRTVRIR